jgi:hypothetical protein
MLVICVFLRCSETKKKNPQSKKNEGQTNKLQIPFSKKKKFKKIQGLSLQSLLTQQQQKTFKKKEYGRQAFYSLESRLHQARDPRCDDRA